MIIQVFGQINTLNILTNGENIYNNFFKNIKKDFVSCNVNINLTGPDTDRTYTTYFTNFDMEDSMHP